MRIDAMNAPHGDLTALANAAATIAAPPCQDSPLSIEHEGGGAYDGIFAGEDEKILSWGDMNDQDTVASVQNSEAGLCIPVNEAGKTRVVQVTPTKHATKLDTQ